MIASNINLEAVNVGGTRNEHVDKGDDTNAPAFISCGVPAIMTFPTLKCKLLFKPGDLIFLRGDIVPHHIEKWGERYSYVNFFEKNVFTEKI